MCYLNWLVTRFVLFWRPWLSTMQRFILFIMQLVRVSPPFPLRPLPPRVFLIFCGVEHHGCVWVRVLFFSHTPPPPPGYKKVVVNAVQAVGNIGCWMRFTEQTEDEFRATPDDNRLQLWMNICHSLLAQIDGLFFFSWFFSANSKKLSWFLLLCVCV